ncbi:MAG: porin family protein [Burkholderiales bacterium]|nr:porin family protein [Burkholderiales bacterium]
MKLTHSLFTAAALAACLTTPAFAQSPVSGPYLGAAIGYADSHPSSNVAGIDTSTESHGGWKLLGGYQIDSTWGVEAQYLSLGKGKYDAPGLGNITFKTRSFAVAATGRLPLADGFSLLGKLGVAHHRFSQDWVDLVTPDSGTDKSSKTTALIGIGAEYAINTNLSLRAEYEYFGKATVYEDPSVGETGKARLSLLSVGLRYRF